jgi:large subunit ribosomal protein L5
MKNKKILQDLRIYEDFIYNYKLDFLTKFNIINNLDYRKIFKISLNFGFKNINFDKKKMIPFFMILELISNQKSYINFSKKNVLSIKIKKGIITGCKVTLRNTNLYKFLDVLLLSLPRYENFKGFFLQKKNKKFNNVKMNLLDLFIFSIFNKLYSIIKSYLS